VRIEAALRGTLGGAGRGREAMPTASAMAVAPGLAGVRLSLGKKLMADGQPAQAIPHLEAARIGLPDDVELRDLLVRARTATNPEKRRGE
jgi:predicted Zn-dependent protease